MKVPLGDVSIGEKKWFGNMIPFPPDILEKFKTLPGPFGTNMCNEWVKFGYYVAGVIAGLLAGWMIWVVP